MMKRITLSILSACFVLSAMAEPVGKQAALFTAKAFMTAKGKSIDAVQKPFNAPRKGAASQQTGQEESYYYVFNAGGEGGYVIVSGDDRTEPILGYVDKGNFDPDNIPENMRAWLQGYADQIKYIVDNDLQPGDPRLTKRNKVAYTKHSIGEILTTRWNQGHPYNLTCPNYYTDKDNVEHQYPATGCTATAMAQVMNFYRFPEKTKAIIPAHTNNYTLANGTRKSVTAKAVPRNTIIDWDNMRDTYNCYEGHAHDRADSAVANLMLYCGQSVQMGWGPSSGANFSAEAYTKYFGFASGAYVGERYQYSIDEWFNLIYDEIGQGYPVLMSGFSSGGGHAFVLDGFDGDNLFHVNWGWGGGSNGWFLVSILNPGDNSGIGASSSSDGYSMYQRALFNLRVPGTPKVQGNLTISDVSLTATSVKAKFTNRTGTSGSYHAGIVMLGEGDSITLVGTKQTITGLAHGNSIDKTFLIAHKLPEGIYRLSPASKPIRSNEWNVEYDFETQYIEAVVDTSGNVALSFKQPIPTGESVSVDTIVFPGTRIVEKQQEVKVTFRNNGAEYFKEVHLYASKTQQKVYTESKSMVAVRPGETVDVSYFFTPEETGTYNLWLCTGQNDSQVLGQGTIEIVTEAEAQKANLSVVSYTITNAVNGTAYGNRIVGKARIKNNKNTEFHGAIRLTVWTQYNGSGSAWGGSSCAYELDIMAGKIADVEFNFDELSENNKYYISASYVNQDGELGNGGVWDLGGWFVRAGIAAWKPDGSVLGKAYATTISTPITYCGVYAECSKKFVRFRPNRNPNTIYAFGADMELPIGIDTCNWVVGKHADHINLVADQPYYVPVSFKADTATYAFTFPETEDGTRWHAFTMPFDADSIFLDGQPVSLDDTLKHFWIYEFWAEKGAGKLVFAPAKTLRGNTPYIIAGDIEMAGRTIEVLSHDAEFTKTGADKMLVSTPSWKFHGNTYSPRLKDCYVLSDDGMSFSYTTTLTTLDAMAPYFTTTLSEETRPDSIALPAIPVAPADPTGIAEITNGELRMKNGETAIYDLSGRQIISPYRSNDNGQRPTTNGRLPRGIYIVGGKKVLY